VAALAVAVKYASLLFLPTVMVLGALAAFPCRLAGAVRVRWGRPARLPTGWFVPRRRGKPMGSA
jgi:hypothetical protein